MLRSRAAWRERVNLATKMPLGFCRECGDMERLLAEQLERLQTDYLDFYLLHGLSGASWDRMKALGVIEFLEAAVADGRIRFPAFSFHGSAADFVRICDEYDGWAFGQIQYNYMDTEFQAGRAGLLHAAEKGMGVVVMEPLKGGKLANGLPDVMRPIFDERPEGWTPAEWALRFVWNEPGVSMLLSGMSDMAQVAENIAVGRARPRELAVERPAARSSSERPSCCTSGSRPTARGAGTACRAPSASTSRTCSPRSTTRRCGTTRTRG